MKVAIIKNPILRSPDRTANVVSLFRLNVFSPNKSRSVVWDWLQVSCIGQLFLDDLLESPSLEARRIRGETAIFGHCVARVEGLDDEL